MSLSIIHGKTINKGDQTELKKKCCDIVQLKGAKALRLSKLYDGNEDIFEKPVDLKIFTENKYKDYEIPEISLDGIEKIVSYNAFGSDKGKYNRKSFLYGIICLINHNIKSNIYQRNIDNGLRFLYAKHDIKKGEEICIDYF